MGSQKLKPQYFHVSLVTKIYLFYTLSSESNESNKANNHNTNKISVASQMFTENVK